MCVVGDRKVIEKEEKKGEEQCYMLSCICRWKEAVGKGKEDVFFLYSYSFFTFHILY